MNLFERLLSWAKGFEQVFMVSSAVLVGLGGGIAAVLFRQLIGAVQHLGWGEGPASLERLRSLPHWWIILVPALGGLVVGPLVYFLAREAKGHGVPEVIEAVALRSGVIRPRVVLVKSLASALSIGTGGSVGREGPIVQIGSAVGSTLGQWLKLSGARLRTLVGCGAAAGIAATFNAPIAGAIFALEVILGDFAIRHFSPIVISSVIATVVSRHFLGDIPAFIVPEYQMVSAWELPIYLLLGLAAGLVALGFVKILYGLEDFFETIPLKPWLLTPIGGAIVGGVGVFYPQVFGVGYEAIEQALHGEMTLQILATLLVFKIFATAITIGSGGSGGVFAPSLFIGAMAGGAFGTLAHGLLPGVTASAGAYALVGMGAVVAGSTHAPITAILIIFELTSDYKLIVPLMAACIIATLVTTQLQRESIYTMKLWRRGVDIDQGRDLNVLKSLHVRDVMSRTYVQVPAARPLGELVGEIATHPHPCFYVVDPEERLEGVIVLSKMRQAILDPDIFSNLVIAKDLAEEDVKALHPDQNLDTVLRIFGGKSREELPVVDDDGKLVGIVTRRHLLDSYSSELMKREVVSGLSGSLMATSHGEVHLGEDYLMVEIDAPGEFVGFSIRDLDVRARYGAQILTLHRSSSEGVADVLTLIPEPDTVVERGDRIAVVGRSADLERLRAL